MMALPEATVPGVSLGQVMVGIKVTDKRGYRLAKVLTLRLVRSAVPATIFSTA